jgi:hypothetical protein
MKKILIAFVAIATLFSTTGCEKYLDVNKNVDAPDYVDDYLYLAGCLSAYQGFYWDIRALGPLTQMMGTSGFTSFASHSYAASSDNAGEIWKTNYFLQGMNLENMIHQAEAREAWTLAGMGYAMKAFSWDAIAKYHGQAPLKQAYESGRLSFDYDSDKDIMEASRAWAEKAIEYLEKDDATNYANTLKDSDLAFHGDKEKWLRFAHSVIVCDLAALTNKKDFAEKYAPALIEHAAKAMASNDDNFTVERGGGGNDAAFSGYNNFWGTCRENLYNTYWQSDYIVSIMTGTVPAYDAATGDKVKTTNVDATGNPRNPNYKYEFAAKQIISDTTNAAGHYDPRIVAKLASADYKNYDKMTDKEAIKDFYYQGSGFTSQSGAPNMYGFRPDKPTIDKEGTGRWLFRDDAPYILLTASEVKFELAEALYKLNRKAEALAAWKEAVKLDMDFTAQYLNPGKPKQNAAGEYEMGGGLPGGSAIAVATYKELADEYVAGPYVNGLSLSDFTLSHIMMQKYVALWPWGALEAWTDMRKYHYDIQYTGEYPGKDNGWDLNEVKQKPDTDASKVYKGFYLLPAMVEGRRTPFSIKNEGSPCYRIRPRYNSEYMWNKTALANLKPISGMADNYHCSMPWFAYPGEYPESL